MRFKHTNRMYPPRVKMTIAMNNPEYFFKLPVKFLGCSSNYQLDTELIFPLGNPLPSLPSTTRDSGWQQANICELVLLT